jgi:uncharacterized membrane protein YfcA
MDFLATLQSTADPWQLGWCVLVILAAYTIRAVTGFGAGLVAIPLMLFVLPVKLVIPVVTTLGLLAYCGQTLRDFRYVEWRRIAKLALPALAGSAVGLWLFAELQGELLRKVLAAFIVAYAAWCLAPRALSLGRVRAGLAPLAGTTAGLVSALFGGMEGPFVVIYLNTLHLDKRRFRASVSALLFAFALLRAGGYGGLGLYDLRALALIALLLPAMVIANMLGDILHDRVDEALFRRVVALLLLVSGAALLLK